MELKSIGFFAITKGLSLEIPALGEERGPARQIKPLPVPLINVLRKGAFTDPMPMLGRHDRIIANFHPSVRMAMDTMAEMSGEHLSAKANAEEGRIFLQWDANPVDLSAQPSLLIIDAHRAAENDDAHMVAER